MKENTPLETILKQQKKQNNLFLIISIGLSLISAFIVSYFNEKGKNAATKEDIETITEIAEKVQLKYLNEYDLYKTKYQLKYNSILKSFEVIDAYYSNYFITVNGEKTSKQHMEVREARKIQTELLLTSSDTLCKLYLKIIGDTTIKKQEYFSLLTKYRSMATKELGFKEQVFDDSLNTFLVRVNFEKNK